MQIYREFFRILNDHSVRYLVTGGIVVNLYGIPRATADIDLVIKLDSENITRFVSAAREIGLVPRAPVLLADFASPEKRQEWATEKHMVVFSLSDPGNPFLVVDVFIEEPFDFDSVHERCTMLDFDGVGISVVPVDELLRMKERTGRPQDKADAYYLRKILEDQADEG